MNMLFAHTPIHNTHIYTSTQTEAITAIKYTQLQEHTATSTPSDKQLANTHRPQAEVSFQSLPAPSMGTIHQ